MMNHKVQCIVQRISSSGTQYVCCNAVVDKQPLTECPACIPYLHAAFTTHGLAHSCIRTCVHGLEYMCMACLYVPHSFIHSPALAAPR